MTKQKGTGVAGGGLAARIKDWEALRGDGATASGRTKMVMSMAYHRPGSQNSRKGGRGKS